MSSESDPSNGVVGPSSSTDSKASGRVNKGKGKAHRRESMAMVKVGSNWATLKRSIKPTSKGPRQSSSSSTSARGRASSGSNAGPSNPHSIDSPLGSPAPTTLPWFADDLTPSDLALVKGMAEWPGSSTAAASQWEGLYEPEGGATAEERRRRIMSGPMGALPKEKTEPGQYIAIDCEMVGVGPRGSESVLARVSLVNYHGYLLYDTFVKPREKVTDYRTWVSGVRPADLKNAPTFLDVQNKVASLIAGRVLVGHALHNDLSALLLSHPRPLIRDTARYQPLREIARTKFPSLRSLAEKVLEVEHQREGEEHSSVEDARVTMAIYRTVQRKWEAEFRRAGRGKRTLSVSGSPASAAGSKKRKAAPQHLDATEGQGGTDTSIEGGKRRKEAVASATASSGATEWWKNL